MKLPYGLADFPRLITGGYVYVDRTAHIRRLEELGQSLLFVRPRRFGKTLWLQTLAAFAALLFQDLNYRLLSEPAIEGAAPAGEGHGFADLVLLLRPDARSTPLHDLLFEFKLLKLEELGMDAEQLAVLGRDALAELPAVAAALEDAADQARRYRAGLAKRYGDVLRLRSHAVVALGFSRLVAREVA